MANKSDLDFLRSRGPKLREGSVEGLLAEKIPKLAAFIRDNPFGVVINSAFRSPQHQAEILRDHLAKKHPGLVPKWEQALSEAGGDVVAAGEAARPWLREAGVTKWVAPPGASKHQRGEATDLGYANDDARNWALANAKNYGLTFPMPHEPWHVELAGARAADRSFGGLPAQTGVAATATPMRMPDLQPPKAAPKAAPEAAPAPVSVEIATTEAPLDFSRALAMLATAAQPRPQAAPPAPAAMPALRTPPRPVQVVERAAPAPKRANLAAILGA